MPKIVFQMGIACPVRKVRARKELYERTLERLQSSGVLEKYGKIKVKKTHYDVSAKGISAHLGYDLEDVHFSVVGRDQDAIGRVYAIDTEVMPILGAVWKDQVKFRTNNYFQIVPDYPIPSARLNPTAANSTIFGEFKVQALAFTATVEGTEYNVAIRPGPKKRSAILLLLQSSIKEFPSTVPKDLSAEFMAAADKIGRQFGEGR